MYEAFYGFAEKPFNITPDPKYLFLSAQHQEAVSHLLYGIQERGGFIVITGEVGTGKTILCRYLLKQLDDRTEGAVILNPSLSELELLKAINEDFGIHSTGTTKKDLLDELNRFLLQRRHMGYNMVLIIDEAQNLSPAVLEQIRLLSNLETETEKLIQIILLGQPELRDLLARDDLRQLNQRITARFHLNPLTSEETGAYIRHRLGVAGNPDAVQLVPGMLRKIFAFSRGTPRLINVLCDRMLLAGFAANSTEMTTERLKRAIREVSGFPPRRLGQPGRWRTAAYAAAALACLALGWGASLWWTGGAAPAPNAVATAALTPMTAAVPAPPAPAPEPHDPPPAPQHTATTPSPEPGAPEAAPAAHTPPPSPEPARTAPAAPPKPQPHTAPQPTATPDVNAALAAAPMAPALAPAHDVAPAELSRPAAIATKPLPEVAPSPPVRLAATPTPAPPALRMPTAPIGAVGPPPAAPQAAEDQSESARTRRLISSLFDPGENRVRNRAPAIMEASLPPAGPLVLPSAAVSPQRLRPQPMPLPTADLRIETADAMARLVEGLRPFDSRLDAAQALFSLWGRDFRPPKEASDPNFMDFYKLAVNQGMRCSEIWANFGTLQRINLPGILEVFSPGSPASRYVVLAAIHGDGTGTILWGPTGAARVSLAALDECWRRRAFLYWQDSEPVGEVLRDGDTGEAVQWVQAGLRDLGYLDGEVSAVYDPPTRQAVIRFQEAFHLLADGVVGPRTRMVLYSRLPHYPTPKLTPVGNASREHNSRRAEEAAG